MATYVMSDIHGCFDDFCKMLRKIAFSKKDELVLAGDYIDRGRQNIQMLRWLYKRPKNVAAIKGNHDVEFCSYVELMRQTDESEGFITDHSKKSDTRFLYHNTAHVLNLKAPGVGVCFDYYRTLQRIAESESVSFSELLRWSDMLSALPFFIKKRIDHRMHIIVHAGYCEDPKAIGSKDTKEDFYIYAREEALKGGIEGGVIVAGHTPTVFCDTPFFTGGRLFEYYDEEKDCTFYNIDGGCAYRGHKRGSRLMCLRLEDGEVFYV